MPRLSVGRRRRLSVLRNAPKNQGRCGLSLFPGCFRASLGPPLLLRKFRAAILTPRPWAPPGRRLQCVLRGHVSADAAPAAGPRRPGPAAPGAARPRAFQASAGADRHPGCRHCTHLLLPVHPRAVRLGAVAPGELQEAGVRGCPPAPGTRPPACPGHVCRIPGRLPWSMSFSDSGPFCNMTS